MAFCGIPTAIMRFFVSYARWREGGSDTMRCSETRKDQMLRFAFFCNRWLFCGQVTYVNMDAQNGQSPTAIFTRESQLPRPRAGTLRLVILWHGQHGQRGLRYFSLFQEFPKFVDKRDTMKFPDRFSLCFYSFSKSALRCTARCGMHLKSQLFTSKVRHAPLPPKLVGS